MFTAIANDGARRRAVSPAAVAVPHRQLRRQTGQAAAEPHSATAIAQKASLRGKGLPGVRCRQLCQILGR